MGLLTRRLLRQTLRRDVRIITFDADGTLVDSREKVSSIHADLATEYGLAEPLVYDGGSIPHQLEARGLSRFAQWRYMREYRTREMLARPLIFPGTNELIRHLKMMGKIVCLVTNRPAEYESLKLLRQSGLHLNIFDLVVTYDPYPRRVAWKKRLGFLPNAPTRHVSGGFPKPDKRAFDPIYPLYKRHACGPASVMHVGDSLPDILAAHGNLFSFIGVLSGAIRNECVFYEYGAKFVLPVAVELLDAL